MTDDDRPVVLAVDDNEDLLETYEIWLGDEYDLRTAASGEAALDQLDDDVQVVLLDRLMPGLSGDEVLARIEDRDISCQVAMTTAVEPDEDVVDLPMDAYVPKALDRTTVLRTVDRLVARAAYDEVLREHYAVAEKLALLNEHRTERELAESDVYRDLEERFEELDARLDERSSGGDLRFEDIVATTDPEESRVARSSDDPVDESEGDAA